MNVKTNVRCYLDRIPFMASKTMILILPSLALNYVESQRSQQHPIVTIDFGTLNGWSTHGSNLSTPTKWIMLSYLNWAYPVVHAFHETSSFPWLPFRKNIRCAKFKYFPFFITTIPTLHQYFPLTMIF